MSEGLAALARFVDRVFSEPALAERVAADPLREALAAGVKLNAQDLKGLLRIPGASDQDLGLLVHTYIQRVDEPLASRLTILAQEWLGLDELAPTTDQRACNDERPLGVLATFPLTAPEARTVAVLARYDLTPVQQHLLAERALPPPWIDEALYEFRRYLGLHLALSGLVLMPSPIVDKIWHTCLLFTEVYDDFCHRAFGRFIHHDPWVSGKPDELPALWSRFAGAYRRMYGDFGHIWRLSIPPALLRDSDAPDRSAIIGSPASTGLETAGASRG